MPKTQIVIVGGGAGGLELARRLGSRFGRKRHDIILVDSNRTHIWKPLLHEVAAGSLDANLDEVGYRAHCHRWGYRYFHGALEGIDRENRRVLIAPVRDGDGRIIGDGHAIRYDYLVLAYGSVTNTFDTDGVGEHCAFLDNHNQADAFRERLLTRCLAVSRKMLADPSSDAQVRVAIVGGGATGVELAAELVNAADGLSYYGLEVFDRSRIAITLVEAGPRILPALPDRLANGARHELEALGIRVREATAVTSASIDGITTAAGEFIIADLQIWAAGVKGAVIARGLDGLELSSSNQLVVNPTLQTTRDHRILAIGIALTVVFPELIGQCPHERRRPHQMAAVAYKNLSGLMRERPLAEFVYRDHGSLVSLSRYSTVGSLMGNLVGGRMAIEGRLARLVYVSLYRLHLIAIHGWLKALALIFIGQVHTIVRPRLKLH